MPPSEDPEESPQEAVVRVNPVTLLLFVFLAMYSPVMAEGSLPRCLGVFGVSTWLTTWTVGMVTATYHFLRIADIKPKVKTIIVLSNVLVMVATMSLTVPPLQALGHLPSWLPLERIQAQLGLPLNKARDASR